MRVGTRREPALVLIFILLTCGLYYLYFIYKVSEEAQNYLGEPDTSPGLEVFLSVITFGLYNIYWDYKIGKKAARMAQIAGLPPTDNAFLYLALDLVGVGGFASLGLLNPMIQQDSLNQIWQASMTTLPPSPFSNPSERTPRQPRPPQQ